MISSRKSVVVPHDGQSDCPTLSHNSFYISLLKRGNYDFFPVSPGSQILLTELPNNKEKENGVTILANSLLYWVVDYSNFI